MPDFFPDARLPRGRIVCTPDWPVPRRVRARFTTRGAQVSNDPYASLNLATHVGDDPRRVAASRARLRAQLGDVTIGWLDQVHGTRVVELDAASATLPITADGSWTTAPRVACAILTADCLPVLLADARGDWVGAAHCGWRGLADGVLRALLERAPMPMCDVTAWIGPGIGAARYRVGREVLERIEAGWGARALDATAVAGGGPSAIAVDLEALARWELRALGVRSIHGGGFCSARDPRFYSYRRDGATGRNVTLVWLED